LNQSFADTGKSSKEGTIVMKLLTGLWAVVILWAVVAAPAMAQQEEDEYETEEQLPYVGLGAGYIGIASFMSLDKLNEINKRIQIEDFKGPLLLHSGNIVFSPGFLPNWRLGLYGAGGFKTASSQVTLRGKPYTRAVSFTVGNGGLMLDRAIRISQKMTLLPGVIAGVGTYAYSLAQTQSEGNALATVISDSTLDGTGNSLNRYGRFLATHIFVHPHLYLEYALTGRFMVRLGAGYSISTVASTWTDVGGAVITNFPDIKADGPTLHIGIFGGLWQE
jgi:hypothetical protein